MTKETRAPREKYLTAEEMPRFLEAIEEETNQTMKDFILTCLFTGALKSNVLAMNWGDINFEEQVWYLRKNHTKYGVRYVCLVDDVIEILQRRKKEGTSQWVFPGKNSKSGHLQEPRKAWQRIIQRANIKDLRLSDLRRTLAIWMIQCGESPYIVAQALNLSYRSARTLANHPGIYHTRCGIERTLKSISGIPGKDGVLQLYSPDSQTFKTGKNPANDELKNSL